MGGWVDETIQDIRWIDDFCRKKGIRFQFVLLPYRSMLSGQQSSVDIFISRLIEYNIPVLDARNMEFAVDVQTLYLWSDEIHFSEEGHQVVARFLQKKSY
jgi:hypothetical protein